MSESKPRQTLQNLRIGNNVVSIFPSTICRPLAQLETICAYHAKHPSIYWMMDYYSPEPDGTMYTCTYSHLFIDSEYRHHVIRVSPTGRITKVYKTEPEEEGSYKDLMIKAEKKFGLFKGDKE